MKHMLKEIQERQGRGHPPVWYRTRGRPSKKSGTRVGVSRGENNEALSELVEGVLPELVEGVLSVLVEGSFLSLSKDGS